MLNSLETQQRLTDFIVSNGILKCGMVPTKGRGLGPGGVRLLHELILKISNRSVKIKPRNSARHTEVRSNFKRLVHMMTDSFQDKHKNSGPPVSFKKVKAKEGGDTGRVVFAVNPFRCVDMTNMMNAYISFFIPMCQS